MSGPALPPIGERLRQARLRRGMTVRGLARVVDVSASLISQIETGKSSPSVSTLYAITAALDISIEDVFGDGDANGSRGSERRSDDLALAATLPDDRVVLVDEALDRFEQQDPDAARIVTLKFFGGFTNREIAETLGVTERTVERQWAYARACLLQLMRDAG